MAVYDGVPSIRLEGDKSRALAFVPDAKALLYRVQSFLKTAEVTTFSASQRLGRDGYVYVLSSHGQNIIHIAVDVGVVDTVEPDIPGPTEGSMYPSFYSGLVFNGFLESRTSGDNSYAVCSTFSPTPTCVNTHSELSLGRQAVKRLAVSPHFSDLRNPNPGIEYSQYTLLRASMYSGTMASAVQVLLGMGKINKAMLRDPARREPDSAYIKQVGERGVQVRYDYKYYRTHGIAYGTDNHPWLIEISQARGVLAMPLPIFPRSDLPGYIDRAVARGDNAMETALTELGFLPTGESFPVSTDVLDERIAAGDILQLLTADAMRPFYRNMPYSMAIGWAFNMRGTEAHNTGYRFEDDNVQRGVWYQVNFNIGALATAREPGDPIGTASANLRRQAEGTLYAPRTRVGRYLPIKFYDQYLPGLRSHDGAPSAPTDNNDPRCDTVMFVCFVGNDLKTVRFFRNPRTEMIDELDDPRYEGECPYNNSWVITQTTGIRGFPTMMYTNDFDDRQTLEPTVTTTSIESRDLGFNPPKFSDYLDCPEVAFVWREKVFRKTVITDRRDGEYVGAVVVIPQFSREAYYYATGHAFTLGHFGSTQISHEYLRDPNVGYSWRNFPRLGPLPWPINIGCAQENCGGRPGFPGPHADRKIVCLDKMDTACSDFADSGIWLTQCQVIGSGFNSPPPNRRETYTQWDRGEDAEASIKLVTRGHGGPISLPLGYSEFTNRWLTPSPSPITEIVQFMASEYSTIGEDCVVYDTAIEGGNVVTQSGYAPETVGSAYPCFIGVNQP